MLIGTKRGLFDFLKIVFENFKNIIRIRTPTFGGGLFSDKNLFESYFKLFGTKMGLFEFVF